MVSCGSHSSAAPAPTLRRTCWRETLPLALYHLAAPGVVSKAWARAPTVAAMASWSPPTTPPGGWTMMAWHTAAPSGCSDFCTRSGPTCALPVSRVVPASSLKRSARLACQAPWPAATSRGAVQSGMARINTRQTKAFHHAKFVPALAVEMLNRAMAFAPKRQDRAKTHQLDAFIARDAPIRWQCPNIVYPGQLVMETG